MTSSLIGWGFALDFFLYSLMVLLLWRFYKKPSAKSAPVLTFVFVCLICFALFAVYDTDYFHYMGIYMSRWVDRSNFEDIYKWLIEQVPDCYLCFRLIIWGTASIFLFSIARYSHVGTGVVLFFFIAMSINIFAYGRVSLAMSMVFLGMTLLMQERKNLFVRILGLTLLVCAYFFHKSALFGIAVVLASIMLSNIGRRPLIFALVCFPVAAFGVRYLIDYVSMQGAGDDSLIDINSAQGYMGAEAGITGIGSLLRKILVRTPYYIIAYLFVTSVLSRRNQTWPPMVKSFGLAAFLATATASLFLFNFGVNTDIIYYRFLYFSIIPNSVFIAYCHSVAYKPRLVRIALMLGILGVLYSLAYSYYTFTLNPEDYTI